MNSDNTMDAAGNLDLIDRYLRNELTPEQLFLFEERLRNDYTFSEEVELQRRIILTVKEAEIRNLLRRKNRGNVSDDRRDLSCNYLKDTREAGYPVLAIAARMEDYSEDSTAKQLDSNFPDFISIPYKGDPNPPFHVHKNFGKDFLLLVLIQSATESYNYHYQFTVDSSKSARLLLFGKFNPKELTLIYNRQQNQDFLKLRIGKKEYKLKINEPVAPLVEYDQT